MSNQGFEVKPEKKSTKLINMIACGVLIVGFMGSVVYASFALMGNQNENYEEKVKMMQEKRAAEEAAATAPVSEVIVNKTVK